MSDTDVERLLDFLTKLTAPNNFWIKVPVTTSNHFNSVGRH